MISENISIIMATYNGAKYIEQQIESIMQNTYKEFVLHICDDSSTDSTVDIVNRLCKKYLGRIVVHRNERNLGVIDNFLHWIGEIDADYYMFSDQDDIWLENKIQDSFDFIKSVEDVEVSVPSAIFADAIVVDGDLDNINDSFFKKEGLNTNRLSFYDLLMENKLLGCSMMINRAARDKVISVVPPIDKVRMHDWWIGLVISAFGRVAFLDKPLLKYRQHGSNQVGATSQWGYLLKNLFNWSKQREQLYAIFRQGEAFLGCYGGELLPEQVKYLEEFSVFYKKSWIVRKYKFISNGYRKTGWIRNLGMWLVV